MLRLIVHRSSRLCVTLAILSASACGGGGSGFEASFFLGSWSGAVELRSNGCPRDIPAEFRNLSFSHRIFEQVASEDLVTVVLEDEGLDCVAERVAADAETFDAVCPDRELPGFLEDLDCVEQRVWTYSRSGSDDESGVVRTAFVRCSRDGAPQLACPVEYRGSAGRCLRGICPESGE